MPSNDEIATQKCKAYAALSSFQKDVVILSRHVVVVVDVVIADVVNILWPQGQIRQIVILVIVKTCGVLVVHLQGNVVCGPDGPRRRHWHW
jgi:hypothetical protein